MHISPDGRLIAVANREARQLVLFTFDVERGALTHLRTEPLPGEPLGVLFVAR